MWKSEQNVDPLTVRLHINMCIYDGSWGSKPEWGPDIWRRVTQASPNKVLLTSTAKKRKATEPAKETDMTTDMTTAFHLMILRQMADHGRE